MTDFIGFSLAFWRPIITLMLKVGENNSLKRKFPPKATGNAIC